MTSFSVGEEFGCKSHLTSRCTRRTSSYGSEGTTWLAQESEGSFLDLQFYLEESDYYNTRFRFGLVCGSFCFNKSRACAQYHEHFHNANLPKRVLAISRRSRNPRMFPLVGRRCSTSRLHYLNLPLCRTRVQEAAYGRGPINLKSKLPEFTGLKSMIHLTDHCKGRCVFFPSFFYPVFAEAPFTTPDILLARTSEPTVVTH